MRALFNKDFPGDEPLEAGWLGHVRRWGTLGLIVLVFGVLVAIPQPINLMTEIPGDEESARFPAGPYDEIVLWMTLVAAPLAAGLLRFRNGFFAPAGIVAALLVSQKFGGMSWDRLLRHEGPFIVIFGLAGLFVIYRVGTGFVGMWEGFRKIRASVTGTGLEKRKG